MNKLDEYEGFYPIPYTTNASTYPEFDKKCNELYELQQNEKLIKGYRALVKTQNVMIEEFAKLIKNLETELSELRCKCAQSK